MVSRLKNVSEAELKITRQTGGSLGVIIDDTKVELLHYPYPQLAEKVVNILRQSWRL